MKFFLNTICIFLFFLTSAQVEKGSNKDEEFSKYVKTFVYTGKESIILFKNNIDEYEKSIKIPSKKQKIHLLVGKMRYIYFTTGNSVHMINYCDQIINLIGNSQEYDNILSAAYRNKAQSLPDIKSSSHAYVMYNYNKAISISERSKNYFVLGTIHKFISNYMQDIHDYDSAIQHVNEAIRYNKVAEGKQNSKFIMAKSEIFLKLYRENGKKKDLDSANIILNKIVHGKDVTLISDAYALKGYASLLKRDYNEALLNIDSSFSEKYHSQSDLFYITDELRNGIKTIAFFRKNMPEKGYKFLNKTGIANPNFLIAEILYDELYKSEKKHGRYKEALKFYEKHNEIQEQNYFINNQLQVRKFKEKLKVAEKDVQLAKLQTNKKNLTLGVIIIANVLLIGTVFFIIYLRRKSKELKKLETNIETFAENEIYKINFARDQAVNNLKKQFSAQLHNDVGSILTATSTFLQSKKKIETEEQDKELWDDIITELNTVYNIIRNESHQMYDSERDNETFLNDLEKNIRIIFSGQQITLHTKINIEKNKTLTPEMKHCFLTMIKESCLNIIKYAKAKNVYIYLSNSTDKLYLTIKNDGAKINRKASSGIGLKTLEDEVLSLSGKFTKTSLPNGFQLSAEIPFKI